MQVRWTSKALSDLVRLHAYLANVNKPAGAGIVKSLSAAPAGLLANPRIGEKLEEFEPAEVRRILVGQYEMRYEMRYEIVESTMYVLRLWHTRENR